MLTPRDFQILLFIATYETVTRAMITRELFPDDRDGRVTRKRLQVLRSLDLVRVTNIVWSNPSVLGGIGAPVYFPGPKLPAFLAQECGDDAYLLLNTSTPHFLYSFHLVEVARTHLMLDKAIKLIPNIRIVEWIGERAIADRNASDGRSGRFRLHVQITDKLVCKPDAAFLTDKEGFHKVFIVEQDRDTTKSAQRVAAQKADGLAALIARRLHLTRYFPCAAGATMAKPSVLVIAPTERRRKALQAAFATKPSSWLYLFATMPDLTPETFLTRKVWYPCTGEATSILKPLAGKGSGEGSGGRPARLEEGVRG